MTTTQFLSHLRSLGAELRTDGDRLSCVIPKSVLTPSLSEELKQRKAEILAFLKQANDTVCTTEPPLAPAARDGALPLSFAQQRLWFLDQLEPDSSAYNIPYFYQLSGLLDVTALEQAANELVRRHESLRTGFAILDGEPVQAIAPPSKLVLPVIDLTSVPEADRQALALRLASEEAARPFNLKESPLFRLRLLRLTPDEHILLMTMHHIVSDAWSMGIVCQELSVLYNAFTAGQPSPLPPLTLQYGDFALWQQQRLQGEILEKQLGYWKKQLADLPAALPLPTDRLRPPMQTFHGARETIMLSRAVTSQLKDLSHREGVTLFVALLAAFKVLLYRYTGQHDLVVGSPIAGRNRTEIEGLVGCFVNTVALRTDLSGDPTFKQLLLRLREVAFGAYTHQDLPFEKLVEELQPQRNVSHTPIFQVMFVLQNAPATHLQLTGLKVSGLGAHGETAKFDLTLSLFEETDLLRGLFEYNTDLFDQVTIKRMAGHFQSLVASIVANPEQRLSELQMLTEAERQQLLVEWNRTEADYPSDKCLHQLFEEQVERTPEAVAVIFEDQQLTYRQLNARANQLSHYLKTRGVGPELLVGICVERSLEMVIGLLGILKAGGAYVPLDPGYPKERLAFMIEDSRAPLLLTQGRLLERLPEDTARRVICVDEDWKDIAEESTENLLNQAMAENLAFVIYTSGSTGVPKGVEILHGALVNYIDYAGGCFGLTPADRVLQFGSISFDLAAEEIFSCLTRGAALVLRIDSIVDSVFEFLENCRDWRITVLDLPTAYWHELTAVIASDGLRMPELIRLVVTGGETALPERLVQWRACIGKEIRLCNNYGPTEATIAATLCELTDGFEGEDSAAQVPIGRPVPNVQVYVLDQNLNPAPIGVPGELFIGGRALARGYLNRPDSTAEKFVSNPFSKDPNARLYRTGDRVRFRLDGNLEFLGRIDHQIKIRGFRVELGEIEAVLGQHPAVRDAVVSAWEDSPLDKRLVAYIVPAQAEAPTDALRAFLKGRLPDYMVPSTFVTLDALPLTPNGKVNRRALPAPDQSRPDQKQAFTPPRTPVEQSVAAIWADVLKLDQVSIHDNFFDLGGHSLLATRVISRLRVTLQVEVPVRSLFESPTVAELAEVVQRAKHNGAERSASTIAPRPRELQRIKSPLQG